MHLVDNVDLLLGRNWGNLHLFAEVADVFDAIIAGGVNFDDIKMAR